jgi:sarcosine oxidase/L-pipecolate oxidase
MATTLDKNDAINIVGAGIFGLSIALHLARRGYRNITVFDKQPYDKTLYSYLNGCDAASAGNFSISAYMALLKRDYRC